MSSRKFSSEAYFLIKARSETPTYRFNSVGHCSKSDRLLVGLHSGFDEFKRLGRGLGSGRDMHVPSSRVPDLW